MALTPYTGAWTWEQAAHLLKRATFGPTKAQIDASVAAGLNASISSLFIVPSVLPPITVDPLEQICAIGDTWINKPLPVGSTNITATEQTRAQSLRSWSIERYRNNTGSIIEKMCLFWHNHFANEEVFDGRATYHYYTIIRQYALGDFKQFVKDMTVSPSMLVFLNGASNNVYSPNENFARELLELYTVSKGTQIGAGNYTNYTETDISESSKILTGWTVNNFWSNTDPLVTSEFNAVLHDASTKTLSSIFANGSISDDGNLEYQNYIDLLFITNATTKSIAIFLSKKLYRYFVNYDITPIVESTVIAEMADQLIADNYVIENTVKALLSSEHFYDISMRGTTIKNPLEFVMSIINTTNLTPTANVANQYQLNGEIYWSITSLGMQPHNPPNVGGWFAYYQAPAYSRLWANSTYIKNRFNYSSWMAAWNGYDINGTNHFIDVLAFAATLDNPDDATLVIEDLVKLFYPKDITAVRKLALKNVLLQGLPDFEWPLQYNDYLANPTNPTFVDPIKNRLKALLYKMFQFPEFQLQ
jgi:uncharacterized protein (DUF1800 family)